MFDDLEKQNLIDELRPHIKRGVTRFLFFPELVGDPIRISFDATGKRRVFWRDLSDWEEFRYVQPDMEQQLANGGVPIMSSPDQRSPVNCDLLGLRAHACQSFITYSATFSKCPDMESFNALFLLPSHVLSILPYTVPVDLGKKSPKQASAILADTYNRIGNILEQSEAPSIFMSGNKAKLLGKLVSTHPRMPRTAMRRLLFIVDRREI